MDATKTFRLHYDHQAGKWCVEDVPPVPPVEKSMNDAPCYLSAEAANAWASGYNSAVAALSRATISEGLRFAEPAERFVNKGQVIEIVVGDDGFEPPTSSV